MDNVKKIPWRFCPLFLLLILFSSCVIIKKERHVIATVDGEPITKEDLEYSLEIAHRREDLSKTRKINIREFIERLVEDRLIIQEARRMGMEEDEEINEKVRAYRLRESVTMLYREEILNKVSVTDEEIKEFYKEKYAKFDIGIIEVRTEEDARSAMKELNTGINFSDVARKYSIHYTKNTGGHRVFRKKDIPFYLKETILSLKPGETSGILKSGNRYYIVRLMGKEGGSVDDFKKVKNEIMQIIRNRKIEEMSSKYLQKLREKYRPWVDSKLLSSIPLKMDRNEKETYLNDQRVIVRINGYRLTVGEFVRMMKPVMDEDTKQRIIDTWINYRVVDLEALSRNYEHTTDLGAKIKRYKDQLLKRAFYERIIRPQVNLSPEEVRDYYETHKDEYLEPVVYKIQKIVVHSESLAKKILDALKKGADFTFLASKYSKDASASRGGIVGWRIPDQMPLPVRKEIKGLTRGGFSDIIKDGKEYIIVKVLDVTERKYKEFGKVKETIYRRLFKKKFQERRNALVEKLKTRAVIKINEDEVEKIETLFSRITW